MSILNEAKNNVAVLILAAGEGKRMKSDLPKVMHELKGKPMIDFAVKAVENSGITSKPLLVVSAKNKLIQDYLKGRAEYVVQREQLGTGHAVAVTEDWFKEENKEEIKNIVVLYGDMPFISSESIKRLLGEHEKTRNVLTLMTTTVPNYDGENSKFKEFGKIVRDSKGKIEKIVELKDANELEKNILEVNTGFFCFDAAWLWSHLKMLRNNNAQGEYYLTDLVQLAIKGGYPISSVAINSSEAVGVNTKDQLENLNSGE